jgi:hypothetical protein
MNCKEFLRPTRLKITVFIVLSISTAIPGTLLYGNIRYYTPSLLEATYGTDFYVPAPFIVPSLLILILGPFSSCSQIASEIRGLGCGLSFMSLNPIYWTIEILLLYSLACFIIKYKK